jgi:hypothetical protein
MGKSDNGCRFNLASSSNLILPNRLLFHRLKYFYSCLLENHIHLLAHDVILAQCRNSEISCFFVMSERLLELYKNEN